MAKDVCEVVVEVWKVAALLELLPHLSSDEGVCMSDPGKDGSRACRALQGGVEPRC